MEAFFNKQFKLLSFDERIIEYNNFFNSDKKSDIKMVTSLDH